MPCGSELDWKFGRNLSADECDRSDCFRMHRERCSQQGGQHTTVARTHQREKRERDEAWNNRETDARAADCGILGRASGQFGEAQRRGSWISRFGRLTCFAERSLSECLMQRYE